jgi:hypothetical protein
MTFVYKYLFTPIWGGGFLFGIIFTWNMNDSFSHDWSRGAAIMVGWALIWLIIMMIRLRSIEATHDNFVIKSFQGQKIIDYKDIEWISQIALINPVMISIKYYDKEIGESKKILILPSMSSQIFRFNFLGELDMTKFIREQITAKKPDYSKELEPSRWLPVGLIFITALPITLIVNKFFMNSF